MDICMNQTILALAIVEGEQGQVLAWEDGQYKWVDPPLYLHGVELLMYYHEQFTWRNNLGRSTRVVSLVEEDTHGTALCCVGVYFDDSQYVCIDQVPSGHTEGRLYFQNVDGVFSWGTTEPLQQLATPILSVRTDEYDQLVYLTVEQPNTTEEVGYVEYKVYIDGALQAQGRVYPSAQNPTEVAIPDLYPNNYVDDATMVIKAVAHPLHPTTHIASEEAEYEEVISLRLRIVFIRPFNRMDFRQRNRSLEVRFKGVPDPDNPVTYLGFDWRITTEDMPLKYPQTVVDGVPTPNPYHDPKVLRGDQYPIYLDVQTNMLEIDYRRPVLVTMGLNNNPQYSADPIDRESFFLNYGGDQIEAELILEDAIRDKWDWGRALTNDEYWAVYGVIGTEQNQLDRFKYTWGLDSMDSPYWSISPPQYLSDVDPDFYQAKYNPLDAEQFIPLETTHLYTALARNEDEETILVVGIAGNENPHITAYTCQFWNTETNTAEYDPFEVTRPSADGYLVVPIPHTIRELTSTPAGEVKYCSVKATPIGTQDSEHEQRIFSSMLYMGGTSVSAFAGGQPQTQEVSINALTAEGHVSFNISGWNETTSNRNLAITTTDAVGYDYKGLNNFTIKNPVNNTYTVNNTARMNKGKDYLIEIRFRTNTPLGQQEIELKYLITNVQGTSIPASEE